MANVGKYTIHGSYGNLMMKYHQLFVRVLGIVTLCALHGWNNRQVSLVPKVYNYCFERIFFWGGREGGTNKYP